MLLKKTHKKTTHKVLELLWGAANGWEMISPAFMSLQSGQMHRLPLGNNITWDVNTADIKTPIREFQIQYVCNVAF